MEDLIKALNSNDEVDRIYAAQDMSESKDPEIALPLIERIPGEDSHAVRDAIVFALKNLPCSRIYDRLFELFRSPDAYLRNAAIGVFGSKGNDAVPFLSSNMTHADGEVRKLVLDALFETGAPQAIKAIRAALLDASVNVRITAVEYLGRLEDKESVDEMIDLLSAETEPMLKIAILESLSMVGAKTDVIKIFSILAPKGDFSELDPLCLPQVINLWTKTGDSDIITRITDTIPDTEIYAEDIVHAIEQAEQQFEGICRQGKIPALIKNIMENTDDQELHRLCKQMIGE